MATLAAKTVIQGIPLSHLAIGLSVLGLLFALGALFEPKKFRQGIEEFFASGNSMLRLAAVLHLLIAFLILNTRWTVKFSSNRSIMSVLGYLILLRGILWLWFPDFVRELSRKFLRKEYAPYAMGVISLVFALGLGYLGIWVY